MRTVILKVLALIIVFTTLAFVGVIYSSDPVSSKLRVSAEHHINDYIENLANRASSGNLTSVDRLALNISVFSGVTISKFKYPEAAKILHHYIHGDGSELKLDAAYFRKSRYLTSVISRLGTGDHGPLTLTLTQSQDWRMSLALNPYFLKITADRIRVYHPQISFTPAKGPKVFTIVPVGRMKIKVFDNLVSALNPTPFSVYAEWDNQTDY